MSSPLFIHTDAVRALADLVRRGADEASDLRARVLPLFVMTALDDDGVAAGLARIDDDLTLVAEVLRTRAAAADYPLHDTVGAALAADAGRAANALLQAVGPDPTLAAQGRAAARSLRDAHGRPGADLLRRIRAQSADASFAYGLATELPPEQAAEIVLRASRAAPGGPLNPAATVAEREAWGQGQGGLLDALGRAYAAAARGTGPLSVPTSGAAHWVAEITADPHDGAPYGQGAALALLLAHGWFDDALLATVADGVYRYERTTAVGSLPLWGPRSSVDDTYGGPLAPDGSHPFDPLASILAAMAEHPAAAQSFLAGGDVAARTLDGVPTLVPERLTYLLEQRRWPVDDASGFGATIIAATTTVRDRSDLGRTSAELASQIVALVAGHTGQGQGGWWVFSHGGWYAPAGLRPPLAALLASYMPDVFDTVQTGAGTLDTTWHDTSVTSSFPPDGPYRATFTTADLATVVEAIGTNPDDARRLLAAVLGTEQLRLGYAVDVASQADPTLAADFVTDVGGVGPRRSLALLANAADAGATALGFVVRHAYAGDHAVQRRVAEAQAAWSDLLQVALGLPFVPTPTGPWGGLVVSQTTSRLFDAWTDAVPSNAADVYSGIDRAITEQMRQLVLEHLANKGLLWPSEPVVNYRPPPPTAFVLDATTGRPAQPLHFDPASADYADWLTQYAPRSWIDTNVLLPYLGQFPRIR